MSSDLLAEFDSFYNPPINKKPTTTPASNDLSFLSSSNPLATVNYGGQQQWQATKQQEEDIWGSMNSVQSAVVLPESSGQDDIWGSFEASGSQAQAQVQPVSSAQTNYGDWKTTSASQARLATVRKCTLDPFSNSLEAGSEPRGSTGPMPEAQRASVPRKPSYHGDVLFDADEVSEEDEEDDDFGDFETVATPDPVLNPQPPPPPSQSLSNMFGATTLKDKSTKRPTDLLSTPSDLTLGGLPYPQAPKSPSFKERNPFGDLGPIIATKELSTIKSGSRPNSASPVTAWPNFAPPKPDPYEDSPAPAPSNAEEEWGDFAELPPEIQAVKSPAPITGIEADAWAWDNADGVIATPPELNEAPPTNIPPPSIILTLFPSLFDLPQSRLFKAVADQPFSLKNRIMSDPSTISFLRAYLLIATVAARIIAGRKLRWKRDTFLSQAMKIGPAAAGGKGGMKLAGVDKSEVIREDREAADVVRVWNDQLGRLRSAVAVANTSLKDASSHLSIPEISEGMSVKTQEGGMTAPKQCLICGLKREERIAKVDVAVEDSFGEWWVDHWGHRACKNFWQEHESNLKSR